MSKELKDYNVIVAFENGTGSLMQNVKAHDKRDLLRKLSYDHDMDNVVSMTVLEKEN